MPLTVVRPSRASTYTSVDSAPRGVHATTPQVAQVVQLRAHGAGRRINRHHDRNHRCRNPAISISTYREDVAQVSRDRARTNDNEMSSPNACLFARVLKRTQNSDVRTHQCGWAILRASCSLLGTEYGTDAARGFLPKKHSGTL